MFKQYFKVQLGMLRKEQPTHGIHILLNTFLRRFKITTLNVLFLKQGRRINSSANIPGPFTGPQTQLCKAMTDNEEVQIVIFD